MSSAAAVVRRSLVRGVLAVLLTGLAAASSGLQQPTVLHVIGHGGDEAAVTAGGHPESAPPR